MTPVEAQMCGAPVVGYKAGGATETVVEPTTGVFFEEQSIAGLMGAMGKLEQMRFDEGEIRRLALRFTWGRFREGIAEVVSKALAR